MRVAFSGTRPPDRPPLAEAPFSKDEIARMVGLLDDFVPRCDQIGTGMCVGVDAYVAAEAKRRGFWVVAFMPRDRRQTAAYEDVDEVRDESWDFLARDRALVEWCETLRAVPLHEEARQPRSGTWYTVRRARLAGKLNREPIILRPLTEARA